MVLGFTFDHRVADGYSINKFIVSLIEAARSRPDPSVPSFQRSLLKPRKPALVDSSTRQMYMPFPSSPPSQEIFPQDALTSRVYYIESDVLEQLQTQASSEGCRRTKLESFTAFLWKTVAAHAGRDDPSKATSKIGVVVDGRRRLAEQDTEEKMATYFGNVISVPFGEQGIGDLMEKPLSWAAKEVHEFLKVAKTRDHFLSLIDYVETRRPQPQMSRIYGTGADEGPAVVVSSGRSFSMSRSDFGWGAAVFSSIYSWVPVRVGFVTPMLSPAANGDWVVYFFLTKEQFQFIDQEASNVFKPLDYEYLSL